MSSALSLHHHLQSLPPRAHARRARTRRFETFVTFRTRKVTKLAKCTTPRFDPPIFTHSESRRTVNLVNFPSGRILFGSSRAGGRTRVSSYALRARRRLVARQTVAAREHGSPSGVGLG